MDNRDQTRVGADSRLVRVWTVTVDGKPVRVATVEQGPRKPSMCDHCSAPCCRGFLHPVLQEDEFKERKFPTTFLPAPDWLKEATDRAQFIAVLAMGKNGCSYLVDGKCSIWPDCPKGCLSYDCREDTRPEIASFVKIMEPTWQEL